MAGDLYIPKNAAEKGNPAIAISGPFGAVKEQSSGFYANQLAHRGFIVLVLRQQFFFFDLERGYILFALDYISIILLFAPISHLIAK